MRAVPPSGGAVCGMISDRPLDAVKFSITPIGTSSVASAATQPAASATGIGR